MLASLVKTIIIGGIGYFLLMAINYKLVAKMLIFLTCLVCLNVLVAGCQDFGKKVDKKVKHYEQKADRIEKGIDKIKWIIPGN